MAKNKAEKNRALVFAAETDESTVQPVDSDRFRIPEKNRLPGGRALKSNGRSYVPGSGNRAHDAIPQEDRCTARRARDGEPCTKLRVHGSDVCGTHGGRAPQVMRKAMARLQNASDKLVQALLAIALDEEQPAPVRLAALRDALDRAGVKSSEKVELQHSMKQWESVLTEVVRAPSERMQEAYEAKQVEMDDDRY